MKKNIKWIIIGSILLVLIIIVSVVSFKLINNKTFFKTTYVGNNNQEMFIPKYSYFKKDCCMYAATFQSLKSKDTLQKEIDDYMKDFEYFEDETTYGYRKGDLFIQSYEVQDLGLYRKIVIVY